MNEPLVLLIADFSDGHRGCAKMCNFLKAKGLHVTCGHGLEKAASQAKVVLPDAILIRLKGWPAGKRQRLQLEKVEQLCSEVGDSVPIFVWADYLAMEERKVVEKLGLQQVRLGVNYVGLLRMLTHADPLAD